MKDAVMDFSVKFGLEKLWKWKWWIAIASIIAGVLSVLLSLRINDEYKSTAAFVPPAFSALGTMVFGNGISYRGFYSADEEDIDRTVAYLNSRSVTDTIGKVFDLYNHFGIKPDDPNREKRFYQTYSSKTEIKYSNQSVVSIECWDTDKDKAAARAQMYLEIAAQYMEDISQRRQGLIATERAIAEMEQERQTLLDSLSYLRTQYGIYHLDHTGDAVTKILAEKMRNEPKFHEYYDEVKTMETYLSTLELRFGDLQREYMTRKLNIEQWPNLIWISEKPYPNNFKDRPKRSIIVILAVMATFVMACFVVVILDRSKDNLPI